MLGAIVAEPNYEFVERWRRSPLGDPTAEKLVITPDGRLSTPVVVQPEVKPLVPDSPAALAVTKMDKRPASSTQRTYCGGEHYRQSRRGKEHVEQIPNLPGEQDLAGFAE